MVSKILVIGSRSELTHELKSKLTRNKLYTVRIVESVDMAVTSLASQAYHLVIMDCDIVNEDKVQLASNLKRLGYGFPILILGKVIPKVCVDKVSRLSKLIVMEKPVIDKEFYGIVNKMILGKDVRQKQHRRFETNQTSYLESFGDETSMPAKMLNLSKGGAYLELLGPNMEVGKIVKVNIELDQVAKNYNVNARIVWSRPSEVQGYHSLGIEFIQASDIYRNLLNNL